MIRTFPGSAVPRAKITVHSLHGPPNSLYVSWAPVRVPRASSNAVIRPVASVRGALIAAVLARRTARNAFKPLPRSTWCSYPTGMACVPVSPRRIEKKIEEKSMFEQGFRWWIVLRVVDLIGFELLKCVFIYAGGRRPDLYI